MIKVNYNINGKIMGFYPDELNYTEIPEPYIEIDEAEYERIFPNCKKYRVQNRTLIDISTTPEYIQEQEIYKKNDKIAELKQKICDIEASQHRAIREHILHPSVETENRISEIEEKIVILRNTMNAISL